MLKTGNLLPFLRRIDNQDLLFFGPGFSCALVWAVPVVLKPIQPNRDTGIKASSCDLLDVSQQGSKVIRDQS
jgi:hypothetical protein